MTSYTLGEALQWMKDNRSYDNRRWFEQIYKFQNWKDEEELKTYLSYIKIHTEEWFKKTPPEWTAEKTLKNAMTGVNSLIKNSEKVKELIGEAECDEITKIMSNILRTHITHIIDYKKNSNIFTSQLGNISINSQEEEEEIEEQAEVDDEICSEEEVSSDEKSKDYDDLHRIYLRQQEIIKENNLIIKRLQKKNIALMKFVKATLPESNWNLLNDILDI
jgi:hypothetical protein